MHQDGGRAHCESGACTVGGVEREAAFTVGGDRLPHSVSVVLNSKKHGHMLLAVLS
jgi:hypothetical protein